MIPVLYASNATVFTTNGLGRLTDCISASVHEERNGAFELELTMPVTGQHFDDIGLGSIITAKPSPTRSAQPFTVYAIEKSMDGMLATIRCEHISYRLSLIPVTPFTASSASAAMSGLISHSVETNPFTVYTDVATAGTYTQTVPSSAKNRLLGEQGSILQTYGGEYLWNGFQVQLLAQRGVDRGTEIRYGKNLKSMEQEQNIQNTVTGILGYWVGSDSDGSERSVYMSTPAYSSNAGSFPFHRTITVDFSGDFTEEPTVADLTTRAQQYITDNDIGEIKISFDVDFAALAQTTEYADVGLLERIDLCDTVTVIFPDFGISESAEVTECDFDVLKERYTQLHIGSITPTLSATIADTSNQIEQAVAAQKSFFASMVEIATSVINGDVSGSAMKTLTDADGNPIGLIFMDTTDASTAVNCIRFNVNGIGFSTSGINGPYETAIYYDSNLGQWVINTTLLNAINISASNIITGTLDADLVTVTNLIVDHLKSYNSSQTTMLESQASYLDVRGYDSTYDVWRQKASLYTSSGGNGVLRLSYGYVDENGNVQSSLGASLRTLMTASSLQVGIDENGENTGTISAGYINASTIGTELASTDLTAVDETWSFSVNGCRFIEIVGRTSRVENQSCIIPVAEMTSSGDTWGWTDTTGTTAFLVTKSGSTCTVKLTTVASGGRLLYAYSLL